MDYHSLLMHVQVFGTCALLAFSPAESDAQVRGTGLDSTSSRIAAELRNRGRAILTEIQFAGAGDTLAVGSDAAIRRLAKVLLAERGAFLVESHIRSTGDVTTDLARTDRRAALVKQRLIAYGFPASRILSMGYGATKPPAPLGGGRPVTSERIELSKVP